MKPTEQRELIEELLGITQLSDKADRLKEQVRLTKADIVNEEARIEAVKKSNERIEETIRKFKIKSTAWQEDKEKQSKQLEQAISELQHINIEQEIEQHKALVEWKEKSQDLNTLNKQLDYDVREEQSLETTLENLREELKSLEEEVCPTCKQSLHDVKDHEKIAANTKNNITHTEEKHIHIQKNMTHTKNRIQELGDIGPKPTTLYEDIDKAYGHKQNLSSLQQDLDRLSTEQNPHTEQIETLQSKNIEELDYTLMNNLTKLKEHQEFLYRLLTSKDSFIRKKIIDQNLNYLNSRLNMYLTDLGLPHEVIFQSDLGVEITELGRELDFDNLSRGERNRLILGLSWAFRDIYESTNVPINLLFIDELIDSGMDTQGVESSMAILKKLTRERQKNVFLISHKDELTGRVNSIMNVVKENGFTSFGEDFEVVSVH